MGENLASFVRLFFFFQAEDGIRDLTVTGVQTCALPISNGCERPRPHTSELCRTLFGCRRAALGVGPRRVRRRAPDGRLCRRASGRSRVGVWRGAGGPPGPRGRGGGGGFPPGGGGRSPPKRWRKPPGSGP